MHHRRSLYIETFSCRRNSPPFVCRVCFMPSSMQLAAAFPIVNRIKHKLNTDHIICMLENEVFLTHTKGREGSGRDQGGVKNAAEWFC